MPEPHPDFFSLSDDTVEVAEPHESFPREIVDEVWENAKLSPGNDAALWRRDKWGSLICRSEYGNRYSSFGWEIVESEPGSSLLGAVELQAVHFDNVVS